MCDLIRVLKYVQNVYTNLKKVSASCKLGSVVDTDRSFRPAGIKNLASALKERFKPTKVLYAQLSRTIYKGYQKVCQIGNCPLV